MRPDPALLPDGLPAGAARLFPHQDGSALDLPRAAPFVIGRLLEDGDGADLRWLTAQLPETDLAAWLARGGSRQLSTRSLAYWQVLLAPPGTSPGEEPRAGRPTADLWPL